MQQRNRLTGLRFKGEEECSHASYDLVLAVLEKDCLTYLGPEKFPTRRNELMQKKPSKEISIDQSQLVVKDKQPELTCPTVTELDCANAFKRRALAFDLAGASTYDTMAAYHADLMDHLHLPAPPGYTPVSVHQILRADRAAFVFMSEKMNTLKRSANGTLPLDILMPTILNQPTVAFHLLPLAGSANRASSSTKTPATERKRSRTPTRPQPKNKGRGKGKSKKGRGPNVPSALIGRLLKRHRRKDCVGLSTCQTDAVQQSQVKPVPKDCTCARNLGALSTILCNSIVEVTIVSPHTPGCEGSLSANFSPWKYMQAPLD